MANQEHLEMLERGVEVWNEWRKKNPQIQPDLEGAMLSGLELDYCDLHKTNLMYTNLKETYLDEANLADASLYGANLTYASLYKANLNYTNLSEANLTKVRLAFANLTNARVHLTCFGDVDLSLVAGLETVQHTAPSIISIETIYRSQGHIPESFLRKAGVPESFITYMRSLVVRPIDYYTCFISYSSKDQPFANRLYADLQNEGVRCWFAPHDMKIGDKIRHRIDESIRLYDKLLLVLSEHSVRSQWVEQEVETALAKEREEKPLVLFPIRLDETVMQRAGGWPALIRNTRHIGDFTKWKQHDDFQQAFERLLRDLKAEV